MSLGGCTASFVSPDGLIVTNHHCVTGGLQYNSTPQRNLLADGYLAKTREEELSSGPGQHVYVTTSVIEVTGEITGNIDPQVDRPAAQRHHRPPHQRADRGLRKRRSALQCGVLFRRTEIF